MAADSVAAVGQPVIEWDTLAARARSRRRWTMTALYAFLIVVSVPILIPYLWMFTISISATTGGTDTFVLWRAVAILGPAVFAFWPLQAIFEDGKTLQRARLVLVAVALIALAIFVAPHLHEHNFRFMWNRNFVDELRGYGGGLIQQFPSVWVAFANSLLLAGAVMLIVVTVATLAGYYISRFAFAGRSTFLRSLLVLHAFPAMTLIIPIFLILFAVSEYGWILGEIIGLGTIGGVVLVICTIELPFAIFIMKGFFDAVPWEIEMSALADGASRRQAFVRVVLPQVKVGMFAIGIFAFIRGWEEYVFVRTLLQFEKSNWVMSLYLFWVADDIMGVDYGMVAAVGVLYVVPGLLLYVFTQKFLVQMTLGGIKG